MGNFTTRINDDLLKKIDYIVLNSKYKNRNDLIEKVLENFAEEYSFGKKKESDFDRVYKMLNRIILLEEQSFANHGFMVNSNIKKDPMLNDMYDEMRKSIYTFID